MLSYCSWEKPKAVTSSEAPEDRPGLHPTLARSLLPAAFSLPRQRVTLVPDAGSAFGSPEAESRFP